MSRLDRRMIVLIALCFLGAMIFLWPEDDKRVWLQRGAVALFALIAYAIGAGPQVTYVLWRAVLALFPVGGLAIALIFGVLPLLELDQELHKALIAGLVVAAGWLAGYVTQELRHLDGRNEHREDMLRALLSEVSFMVKRNEAIDWKKQKERAAENFVSNRGYVPFVHLKMQNFALNKVLNNIEILAKDQISSVTVYGHLINEIAQLTETIKSEAYAKLDAKRREQVLDFWLDLQSRIPAAGKAVQNKLSETRSTGVFERPE